MLPLNIPLVSRVSHCFIMQKAGTAEQSEIGGGAKVMQREKNGVRGLLLKHFLGHASLEARKWLF